MWKIEILAAVLIGFFGVLNPIYSQSQSDFKNVLDQAKRMGYSDQQIKEYAIQQGISLSDDQLKSSTTSNRQSQAKEIPNDHNRVYKDSLEAFPKSYFTRDEIPEDYFGYSYFSFSNFSGFESNLKLSTPKNYKLGVGDEVYIDIYGKSELYYEAKVDNDGYILLENVGPINVSGLTLERVDEIIKAKFSKIYVGLNGQNPDTFIRVTLGSVRSITVQLVGELFTPGSYKMSSFSTVINALHLAGGPTINGTLREIEVYRNGKRIASFDLYKFLKTGIAEGNIILEDNDVVLVGNYKSRVILQGSFKRPGIFEIRENESMANVLSYAGGFDDFAYSDRVTLVRNLRGEKVVSDVYQGQFEVFDLKGGDIVRAGQVLDRYTNRVQIKGAVYRPGPYAYYEDLTLTKLISLADGLKGDAYSQRILVTRIKSDLKTETLSANLSNIQNGTETDLILKKEDVVWVRSIFEMNEEFYLKISGEVNMPGTFAYSENLTVADLIFKAKGFTNAASKGVIEISRRATQQTSENQTEIFTIQIPDDRDLSDQRFSQVLHPYDHVMVRKNPNYFSERTVRVIGEVQYPGTYAVLSEQEKISDIILRAGGIRGLAYPQGATLIRRTEFYSIEEESQVKRDDLTKVRSGIDSLEMTEADKMMRQALLAEIMKVSANENKNLSAEAKSERLQGIANRGLLSTEINIKSSELIPLNLDEILKKPGGKSDLILQEGDVITIPQKLETIRLRGRVLYPTTVKYVDNKGVRYFISQAGGYDSRALKRKTYVLYANGEVARTKSFLVFKSYPKIFPGTEIIVPTKPIKPPIGIGEYAGMGTSLAALILAFNNLLKP